MAGQTLSEAIGHGRYCPNVCLTADKAHAWFAARVEDLAAEWEQQGREAEKYINRAHHTEIDEVMAEARWYPARAAELRALLGDA